MMAESGMETTTESNPVTEKTPQFKNIKISNITVNGALQAVYLQGLPEMNLENVVLENMVLEAKNGFTIIDANQVKISNIKLVTDKQNAIDISNCKNIEIKGLEYNFTTDDAIRISGPICDNISLNSAAKNIKEFTTVAKEVKDGVVTF